MKKHINLLYDRRDYIYIETIFLYFRRLTYIFFAVCLLITAISFVLKEIEKKKYTTLLSKKEALLKASLSGRDFETKTLFVNDKASEANQYLADDVNFLPYYELLKQYLPVSTTSAEIKLISHDNKKNTSFVVEFSDHDSFIEFIDRVEDPTFLDIFNELSIQSFSISDKRKGIYSLKLTGRFKSINEIKI